MNEDAPVAEDGRLHVEGTVGREEDVAREAPADLDPGVEGLGPVIGEVWKARQLIGVEDVAQDEVEAAVVEEGVGHGAVRRRYLGQEGRVPLR